MKHRSLDFLSSHGGRDQRYGFRGLGEMCFDQPTACRGLISRTNLRRRVGRSTGNTRLLRVGGGRRSAFGLPRQRPRRQLHWLQSLITNDCSMLHAFAIQYRSALLQHGRISDIILQPGGQDGAGDRWHARHWPSHGHCPGRGRSRCPFGAGVSCVLDSGHFNSLAHT